MKKLILTGIGFFLALSLTFAQQGTPEETAAKATTELVQKLNLSDEQRTAVSTILLDQAKTEQTITKDSSTSTQVKTESLNKLQSEVDTKVNQLLTEDQKSIYQKIIAERPAKSAPAAKQPVTTAPTH
jgi:LysM repeat protein